MPRGIPKNPVTYRRRCRFCHKLFTTTQAHAKYCPKTNHLWLHWEQRHPRIKLERGSEHKGSSAGRPS